MVAPAIVGAVAAGLAALSLSIVVAVVLAHLAEEGDLSNRIRGVMQPLNDRQPRSGASFAAGIAGMFARLGEVVLSSTLVSAHDLIPNPAD
jgi:hypothetical protein